MKAVVMAGGEGTRLRPLTSNQPKPMVPIVGKPCMEHILELLRRHGLNEVVDTTTTMHNAQTAMDQAYDDYDAAALLAGVATDQATEALVSADRLRDQTKQARTAAREIQRSAADDQNPAGDGSHRHGSSAEVRPPSVSATQSAM